MPLKTCTPVIIIVLLVTCSFLLLFFVRFLGTVTLYQAMETTLLKWSWSTTYQPTRHMHGEIMSLVMIQNVGKSGWIHKFTCQIIHKISQSSEIIHTSWAKNVLNSTNKTLWLIVMLRRCLTKYSSSKKRRRRRKKETQDIDLDTICSKTRECSFSGSKTGIPSRRSLSNPPVKGGWRTTSTNSRTLRWSSAAPSHSATCLFIID